MFWEEMGNIDAPGEEHVVGFKDCNAIEVDIGECVQTFKRKGSFTAAA